jgi:Phage X family/Phage replication protein CRI
MTAVMFFDWLSCYQDFDYELPIISADGYAHFDFNFGEFGKIRQSKVKHEGSFSTSISVHVQGNRIVMEGNPSRFNRLDNLFGFTSLDDCFTVYNSILKSIGLPEFTKCTFVKFQEKLRSDGSYKLTPIVNGAVIIRLDLTSNQAVGVAPCVASYLKALSMMPYRRSRGFLYPDGNTAEWKSILGNAREIYPCVYNKAHEFTLHLLPKIKAAFGVKSPEYVYITSLINYCSDLGVTRHELKIKSPFLNKNNLQYYGLSDYSVLESLHAEFMNIDQNLKVSAMDLRTIALTLVENDVCANIKAANTTALYAINWMHGDVFDGQKKQVQVHRARLRKIGIDILKPCNIALFSPVVVKQVIEIERCDLQPPPFYKFAELPNKSHLRLVA